MLFRSFTERDHAFLMSFKRGQPDWALFDYPNAADLPAIRWKLQNINKLAKNQKPNCIFNTIKRCFSAEESKWKSGIDFDREKFE